MLSGVLKHLGTRISESTFGIPFKKPFAKRKQPKECPSLAPFAGRISTVTIQSMQRIAATYSMCNVYSNGGLCELIIFIQTIDQSAYHSSKSDTEFFPISSSSHCPICRSICTVRNTRVLHFSSDNATVEDEFMVDLQHFKSGMKRLLGDQDNEIASLHKQLSEEKRKRLKADGLVQDLNG